MQIDALIVLPTGYRKSNIVDQGKVYNIMW
jgi:hypothetical protein